MKKHLVIVALGLIFAFSCHREEKGVLYKVGDGKITLKDAERVWLTLPQQMKLRYSTEEGRRAFLENLIALELLYQEALRQKLDQDPVVKFRLERARKHLLAEELVERALSPEDLYMFYQENFIHLDGIIFSVKDINNKREVERAGEKARRVYRLLKAGRDFNKLKETYNPERKDEDLGYFSREGIIDAFGTDSASELFGLEEKENFTKPVLTPQGWIIFYILERPGNLDPKGYREVWDEILTKKREEIFRALLSDLRSKIEVKEYPENIDKFVSEGRRARLVPQAGATASQPQKQKPSSPQKGETAPQEKK